MDAINRTERQILRRIQHYEQAALLDQQAVIEQMGTVDVYFHPTNPDPAVNCVTPHKGVAWFRREDLASAFSGLERLGRDPRLVFQDALFPQAFQQQLTLLGLELESEQVALVYHPLYGPVPPGELPFGCLPPTFHPEVRVTLAADGPALTTWLRIVRAGQYHDDAPGSERALVDALVTAVQSGRLLCVLAAYQGTPLGAARLGLLEHTAELEVVITAPLWHNMGLEEALIAAGVRAATERGCDIIFSIQPPEECSTLYHRLGFERVTRLLTYHLPAPTEPGS